jgi:short-subunit dehydrogenase
VDSRKYLQFWKKYGPYALIAGGSDGLGAAFAEAVACRGLNLILIARDKERLETTADRLREKYNIDVLTLAADLADYEKIKNFVTSLNVTIGFLVYNAAYLPIGLFENTNEEHLSQTVNVNVRSPLLLIKLLSVQMVNNEQGGIVIMSSLAGAQGSPKLAAYAATKAFNAVLAEGLWKELKPRGVDVIGCCAGAVFTHSYQQAGIGKKIQGIIPARAVAEKTLKALGKGPIIVPGIINKICCFVLSRFLTKKAAIDIIHSYTGGLSI